jgi:nucleoside 2-deoxyribosyltransferase
MFLKPLAMMSGTVASIGYPAAKERPAMFLTPS